MTNTAYAIALFTSLLATSAVADDDPYRFHGYWRGKHVAGRTYCSNVDVLSFQKSDNNRITGKIAARERITFGWAGELVVEFLSVGVNLSIEGAAPTITFVDDTPRDPRTGTYTQTGSRVDVVLDGGAGEDIAANWYVSGDGSVIHGAVTRRITPVATNTTIGETFSWTLIEGSDCVADTAFPPY